MRASACRHILLHSLQRFYILVEGLAALRDVYRGVATKPRTQFSGCCFSFQASRVAGFASCLLLTAALVMPLGAVVQHGAGRLAPPPLRMHVLLLARRAAHTLPCLALSCPGGPTVLPHASAVAVHLRHLHRL